MKVLKVLPVLLLLLVAFVSCEKEEGRDTEEVQSEYYLKIGKALSVDLKANSTDCNHIPKLELGCGRNSVLFSHSAYEVGLTYQYSYLRSDTVRIDAYSCPDDYGPDVTIYVTDKINGKRYDSYGGIMVFDFASDTTKFTFQEIKFRGISDTTTVIINGKIFCAK